MRYYKHHEGEFDIIESNESDTNRNMHKRHTPVFDYTIYTIEDYKQK